MTPRAVPLHATVAAALIVAGFGFSLAANWPGHLSYDSVIQLLEGRTAIYANWHPPVMSWMLGLGDAVLPGAALFVLFDSVLIFGSLLGLLLCLQRVSWVAPAVVVVLIATPQFLIYPGIVWKDVLFAAATLAGFVALALGARFWDRRYVRPGLFIAAFGLFLLGALARQNGMLVAAAGAVAAGWIAGREGGVRAGVSYGLGGLAGMALVGLVAHAALAERVRGTLGPETQIRLLQTYDMIGALHAEPSLTLAPLKSAAPALDRLMRSDGVRLYSPARNDTLGASHALMDATGDADPEAVAQAWRGLILGHPWLYLDVRWAAFRWLVAPPDLMTCHPYYLGISGPPAVMKALGYARRWDGRDQALADYAHHFVGTPILAHGFFAALAAALLILLLLRRRSADIAIAGLLAAALAFTASFFVISIACDYRYLYTLDLAAMAGAFYAALEPRSLFGGIAEGWRSHGRGVWRGLRRRRSSAG